MLGYGLFIVAIAVLVVVTSIIEPKFLTSANFENIIRQFGTLIFAALGMTFVIMAGFLDLSIGGIIGLVAVVTVTLIDKVEVELDPVTSDNVVPMRQRLSLLELNKATCHWPIGDPSSPDFFFCGGKALTGLPYCAHHSRVAYQPATDRRRTPPNANWSARPSRRGGSVGSRGGWTRWSRSCSPVSASCRID